jgi:uncharacterized protein (TIGR00725 family)
MLCFRVSVWCAFMPVRKIIIGVIGASQPSSAGLQMAEEVGCEIATRGAVLVCGGLGGVMEAAAKGAAEAGGEVIGLLPGPDRRSANSYVTLPVPTNMGHARNVIIAHTAEALIAVEGEYGTLSETAIALKLGKPVFVLPGGQLVPGTVAVASVAEAITLAFESLKP